MMWMKWKSPSVALPASQRDGAVAMKRMKRRSDAAEAQMGHGYEVGQTSIE